MPTKISTWFWGAFLFVSFSAISVQADGVHSAPFVLQDAKSVTVQGRKVVVDVAIQNLGTHPVSLQAVSAKGTVRKALFPAPTVAAGRTQSVTVDLQFYRDIPSAFSLILDFGAGGTNTALVKVSK